MPGVSNSYTQGSAFSANFVVCKHGTTVEIGSTDRCQKCDDERWEDWFKHFMDRWEAKHGHRWVLHGYDEDELREAYEHRF